MRYRLLWIADDDNMLVVGLFACLLFRLPFLRFIRFLFLRQRSLEFYIKKFAKMIEEEEEEKVPVWLTSSCIMVKLFETAGNQNSKWDRLNWMVSNSINHPTYSFIISVELNCYRHSKMYCSLTFVIWLISKDIYILMDPQLNVFVCFTLVNSDDVFRQWKCKQMFGLYFQLADCMLLSLAVYYYETIPFSDR